MISVTGKKWLQQRINKNLVEKVKQDYNLNYDLSQFIVSRNYDISEIHSINNTQKINNIFINDYDFQKASSIVLDAIKILLIMKLNMIHQHRNLLIYKYFHFFL